MPPPISARCFTKNSVTIPRILRDITTLSAGSDTVDLGTAENWLIRPELLALLRGRQSWEALTGKDLSYASGIGGSTETRQALSRLFNEYFHPTRPVDPGHLVLAAGGSSALDALIQQLCDPGDCVMVPVPYWSGLDISLSVQNEATVLPVKIPLATGIDGSFVEHCQRAIQGHRDKVKALLICNPDNPTGACFSKAVLEGIVAFCEREQIHLISDEVYALSMHHGASAASGEPHVPFTSILAVDSTYEGVHMVYSLSKDLGCSGLRLGALVTQHNTPVRLGTTLSVGAQVSCFASLAATHSLLAEEHLGALVQLSQQRLQKAYLRMTHFCQLLRLRFLPANAGPYLFVRLIEDATPESESELLERLRDERIALAAGRAYHCQEPGWFRIAFAVDPDVLTVGFQRIESALTRFRLSLASMPESRAETAP